MKIAPSLPMRSMLGVSPTIRPRWYMLGCIQPMSSPMMKRILGFCAGCCAAAGVLAGPDNDINIVALISDAQDRFFQPAVFRGTVGIAGVVSLSMQSGMASFSRFMMQQRLLA